MRDHFKRPVPISAPEDRYDLLGRSIAIKLRSIEKRQRLMAEKIINDTLFDAEMGNLSTESFRSPRNFTFIPSPSPSPISRTPSSSPSLIQQYYTHPQTYTTSSAPQRQPCSSLSTQPQTYTISPAPQRQPCSSQIQQYNTNPQTITTSPPPQSQLSPSLHEEYNTQLQTYTNPSQTETVSSFYSNFDSELI